jgi:hypothetical protein
VANVFSEFSSEYMNSLRNFYLVALKFLVLGIACAAFFLADLINTYTSLRILASTGIAGSLFLGGEWAIRKILWKLVRPEFDFSGEWLGLSTYAAVEVESTLVKKESFVPFGAVHPVQIHQDCLRIAINPKGSKDYTNWQSVVCEVVEENEEGRLKFAYIVRYKPDADPKLPRGNEVIGFEDMHIEGWAERYQLSWLPKWGRRKIPVLLRGGFWHCAQGQTPVYQGTTLFVRRDYFDMEHPTLSEHEKSRLSSIISRTKSLT